MKAQTNLNLGYNELNNLYFFSIRPEPWSSIIKGQKKHEFRKIFLKDEFSVDSFVYASAPVMQVLGRVVFGKLIQGNIETMLDLLKENPAETEEGLREYFREIQVCYARPILTFQPFAIPVSLKKIRKVIRDFNPPMNYYSLNNERLLPLKNLLESRAIVRSPVNIYK